MAEIRSQIAGFSLWVSSPTTLTKEEEELIKEIKKAGIPCDIVYGEPNREEPVLHFNCCIFRGFDEIRRFIRNWDKVWKPDYEKLVREKIEWEMTRANAEPKYHPEEVVSIKTKTFKEALREENSWLLEAILKVAPTVGRKLTQAGIPDKIKDLPEDKQCEVLALLLLAELIEQYHKNKNKEKSN
jgi:hypothetical protein